MVLILICLDSTMIDLIFLVNSSHGAGQVTLFTHAGAAMLSHCD